ncbi:phage protease [Leisingera sp. M658]|uniref:phage protease n=1 Tax=Leisingera sp. M658 TaxID=2867015 RepID=UPI0021A5C462|nr:phage protease [Leisingera sp. M658]UWQ76823.1 phage protease [Leisingera sp. M658]
MGNTHQTTILALQSELPSTAAAGAPDWVHLLPTTSGLVQTNDRRGPYNVTDAEKIIAASFAGTDKLVIDENHATDLAAPKGLPAPARGWITEMQAREDGIWGRVEWTGTGRALLEDRAFSGLSPVVGLPAPGSREIVAIRRASLVNQPNLLGLTALNQQENETMTFQETLAKLLGLASDASEDDITKALKALKPGESTALQSQMGEIGVALGCVQGAAAADILAAAKGAGADEGKDAQIVALQSSISALEGTVAVLSETVTTAQAATQKTASELVIDQAIREMRVGVQPSRDEYIAMHQENPERTEKLIAGLPKLDATATTILPPDTKDGVVSLQAEEANVATLLGLSPEEFQGEGEASK